MIKSDEIDYEIHGHELQVVEVELDPNETVIAEAGAMSWMESGISYEAKMGDGTETKKGFFDVVVGIGKRAIAGESLFITHFTNRGVGKKKIAFAAPYPGTIIPVDLSEVDNEIICQKNGFLCAAFGTKIDIAFNKKIGSGLFGGEGFILERLTGDGKVFIHAGGTVVKKELNNEKILVDTGCVVAFSKDLSFDIERAGNLKSMLLGGEGLFLATLEGTGTVYLQSLPFSKLADRIIAHAPKLGGSSAGEGSVLGGVGQLFDR